MSNYEFQKLTPIRDADITVYEEALDYALSQDDVHNIAVTGAYSAGKSSIIETYKNKKNEKLFLNISLANFANFETENINVEKNGITNEATIEGKILNQLIHQIKPENIPQTHFKVKKDVTSVRITLNLLMTLISMLLVVYVWKFNHWRDFVLNTPDLWIKEFLGITTLDTSLLIAGIILTSIVTYAIFKVIQMISVNKILLRKLKIQGHEIEIFENTNDSYFDKYLNEVLYLFENSNAEVIVFEDIDRFDSNVIFAKLREINTLINGRSSKKVKFLYLIKDDTFSSKDRTKFFDFIVPVIPIVDGSNSYDLFIEYFRESEMVISFNEFFLKGISLYIDDLRLLKNIYNEYLIYQGRIQTIELDPNRLLAIIVYKNIFPHDFSELQLSRGFVFNVLRLREELIKERRMELQEKISEVRFHLKTSDKEHIEDIEELEFLFFSPNVQLHVSGKTYDQFEHRGHFMRALKENTAEIYYHNGRALYSYDKFDIEYQKVLNNDKFKSRKKNLELKLSSKRTELQAKINELQQQLNEIEKLKLYQLTLNNEVFNIIYSNELGVEENFASIKSSPYFDLIKYLIRNGYLDESFQDYMTYFYENSLTRVDKIFLRGITDLNGKAFNYKLNNPALVLTRISDAELQINEALNYDLLTYMLENENEKSNILLNQIIKRENYNFITSYWEHDRATESSIDLLISKLNITWKEFANGLLKSPEITTYSKNRYLLHSMYNSSKEEMINQNIDKCITNYVSKESDFLNMVSPNIPKVIDFIDYLSIKFEFINLKNVEEELFDLVYAGAYYQINYNMLSLILEHIYGLEPSDEFKHKNLSLLKSRQNEPIVNYIMDEINTYMELYLGFAQERVEDEESVVVEILNIDRLLLSLKERYVSSLHTLVDDLSMISQNSIIKSLVREGKVKYTEKNVLHYLKLFELDEVLVEFFNENGSSLLFSEILYETILQNSKEEKYDDILACSSLNDEIYEMLIQGFGLQYDEFEHTEISYSKMRIIIRNNIIVMNAVNFVFINNHYPDNFIDFVTSNIEAYIHEVKNDNKLQDEDILILMESGNIHYRHKLALLNEYESPISVLNKTNYSDDLTAHILRYNFELNDLPELLKEYNLKSEQLKNSIEEVFTENINNAIGNQYYIPNQLIYRIFRNTEVEYQNKIDLFIDQFTVLSLEEVKESLRQLKLKEFHELFDRKRPKFEINSNNKRLLDLFTQKGWINEYKTETVNDHEYYRAAGKARIQEFA